MRLWIGITDGEWFRFLRDRPDLDEVNFWQPNPRVGFRALDRGELFLFKLHAPENFIVGAGYFASFSRWPYRTAWEFFGEKNGAASMDEMRRQIGKYRKREITPFENPEIGCIMIVQPSLWERELWIPIPEDFSLNIQRGKTYDTGTEVGHRLWQEVKLRMQARPAAEEVSEVREQHLYGEPTVMRPRLGQGTFRSVVTDLYQRRCAVTLEKALPVLDASHILPVKEGGQHDPSNGLLFRADIHRLFDSGYVTVTPDHRFRVSRRLKSDFDNGEPYYPYDGHPVELPRRPEEWPSREHLEWHGDTVFLG